MDQEHDRSQSQVPGPLHRRISRRDAIKIGGLATLGLAFHRPVIETIRPTQIFANNCYGCPSAVVYNPSPVELEPPPLPPRLPETVTLTTTISFCVDETILSNGGLTVELVDEDLLNDTVLASQFIAVDSDVLPGTCIQNQALVWVLVCSPSRTVTVKDQADTGESDTMLSVRFGGQKVGQVRAYCGD